MEILYATFFGFFLLLVIYFFYNHKSGGNATRPPGKTGFPVIGETLEFLYTGWKGHPEKFIVDRMAKYSSHVFKTSLFGSQVIVFCGPNGHRFLFSNENKLVQVWAPSSFDKVFQHYPYKSCLKESLKRRQMFPNLFKPLALQSYLEIIDTVAHSHFVTEWENKGTVVIVPLAYHYNFLLSCHLFLSVEDPNHIAILKKNFRVLAAGIMSMPIDFPGTPLNRAIKASDFIRKELLVIIKQRKIDLAEGKVSPTQDILSTLLMSDDNSEFTHDMDIANQLLGLIFGGHDPVSSACSSIVKYLAELPEIYQEVYEEQVDIAKAKAPGELLNWNDIQKMRYSWNVACEAMRLEPPGLGFFREALEDFEYNGFSIQKGSKILWSPFSTHHNHEFFAEPQKFDPSRFEGSGPAPYTYVPFGGGSRICYGQELARLKILVFIHHLVKRFRWEKLIPDEKVSFIPLPLPKRGLPIRLFPHEAYAEHISADVLESERIKSKKTS